MSARDLGTGKQQSITITGSSNLSEQEIRRAMDDAAAFAGQDQERKAAIEALNAAEAAIYRANSALGSKVGKELDKDTKNRIKEAEKNLERLTRHKKPEKMTPQDTQALNAAREALQAPDQRPGSTVGSNERKVGVRSFWATGAKKSCLNIETKW